jgi:hypothetical protein
MKNCGSQPSGRKQDTISWCISSSWDAFWSITRLPIDSDLVSILVCYPIFGWCYFYMPNSWHVSITHGCVFGNGVTISTPWCHDETGSLLWHATQGCAVDTRRYQGLLVMIYYGATPMCYLLMNVFLGYYSLSCQKISTSNQEISFFWDWNLDSWLQPLHHAYIIHQQPSNIINAY